MSYETIQYDVAEGVGTVTLNRPDVLNCFTPQMHKELRDAFKDIARNNDIRCVLLTGAGRAFCSGADLSQGDLPTSNGQLDLGAALEKDYNRLIHTVRGLEKPVVAAVNGVAAGAGASFAFAADIAIAARSAEFIQAFVRIGLVPDAGGTYFLPRRAGLARALGMALTGEPVSAEQAEQWGLIWKCVDDDALMAEATGLARRLAAGPTKAYGLIKRAMDASLENTLGQQLDLERDLQRVAGRSQDFMEGVSAFLQKRPAEFKGK
jgi:2-(1,2-epoxy-1,2-dihydrophenyl)acetyl-CoA isomerase